jgi:hypothetical protein
MVPHNTIKLTKEAVARLESLSHDQRTRNLTGLFFEFMAPNHRHQSCPIIGKKQYPPVLCKHGKKMGEIPQHYWNAYHCEAFRNYVDNRLWTMVDSRDTSIDMPSPDEIPWDNVYTELRRSYAIGPWIHSGNKKAWVVGDPTILTFTFRWLMGDNELRQRPVLQFEEYKDSCDFTRSYADMIAEKNVEFKQLLEESMERLDWTTSQPLKMNHRQYKNVNMNFQ